MSGRVAMRVVQDRGVGDMAWHPDGKRVICGGFDGTLQVIHAKEEADDGEDELPKQQPKNVTNVKSPIIALSIHPAGTLVCVSTKERQVSVYDVPLLDFQETVLRTTLDVTHVSYSPTGSFIACACEDGSVDVVNALVPQSAPVRMKPHHSGPALGVAFDPLNTFVASVGADGDAFVFEASTGTRVGHVQAVFPKVTPGSSESLPRLRPAWSPDGNLLAVPGAKDVSVVARSTWAEAFKLAGGHTSQVTAVSWSKNGKYCATLSAADGVVLVWSIDTKESIHKTKVASAPVCTASWGPDSNAVAILDSQGQLGLCEDVVPKSLPAPNRAAPGATAAAPVIPAIPADLFGQGEEEKKKKGKKKKRAEDAALDSEVDDGEGIAEEEEEEGDSGSTKRRKRRDFAEPMPLQPAMQPAASSFDKKRRFLAYNNIGYIASRDQGSDQVLVIEFADQTKFKRSVTVDHHRCLLGALGERGAATANPHFVVFHAHAAVGASSHEEASVPACDWVRQLPEDETAIGLAISDVSVCVATSRRFLRLFSLTGSQQAVLTVPGQHLCITAREGAFVEAFHGQGGQVLCMCFTVSEAGAVCVLHEGALPLTPGSALAWLGFSESMALVAVDTAGLLTMRLETGRGACWVPMLDFAPLRRQGESHWVVDVTQREALCVYLRNGDTCPPTAPPPLVDAVPLTPPLIHEASDADTALCVAAVRDRAVLEHRVAAGRIEGGQLAAEEAQLDVCVLKVIQAALKAAPDVRRDQRILGLCRSLSMRKSLSIAAKYASAAGASRLAETIIAMFDAAGEQPQAMDEGRPADEKEDKKRKAGAGAQQDEPSKKKTKP